MIFVGLYIVVAIGVIITLFILTGRAIHNIMKHYDICNVSSSVNCIDKDKETVAEQTIDIEKKMVYHDGKLIETHCYIKRGE